MVVDEGGNGAEEGKDVILSKPFPRISYLK